MNILIANILPLRRLGMFLLLVSAVAAIFCWRVVVRLPDTSTPRHTAVSFARALEKGDMKAVRTIAAGTDADFSLAEQLSEFLSGMRGIRSACIKKFGTSDLPDGCEMIRKRFESAEEQVNSDKAILVNPSSFDAAHSPRLHKTGHGWVLELDYLKDDPFVLFFNSMLRPETKSIFDEVTREVLANHYPSQREALAGIEAKFDVAKKHAESRAILAPLDNIIRQNPKVPKGYFNRGNAYIDLRIWDQAIADFTRVIELDPKDAGAYVNRGLSRSYEGDSKGAIEDLTHAIELEPDDAQAHFGRGIVKEKQGDLDGALADLDRAIEAAPINSPYWNSRANVKAKRGDLMEAIADYNRAIEIDPKNPHPYYNRGMAEKRSGHFEPAIADFTKAIALDPKNAAAYGDRGIAKKTKGDLTGALADYDRAIEIDPKDPIHYLNRGNLKGERKDFKGALEDFDRAIKLDQNDPLVYRNRGTVKNRAGDAAGALADFDHAVGLNPNDPVAFCDRARLKRNQPDVAGALADYARSITLDPKFALAYLERSEVELINGKPAEGYADLDRGAELDFEEAKPYLVTSLELGSRRSLLDNSTSVLQITNRCLHGVTFSLRCTSKSGYSNSILINAIGRQTTEVGVLEGWQFEHGDKIEFWSNAECVRKEDL